MDKKAIYIHTYVCRVIGEIIMMKDLIGTVIVSHCASQPCLNRGTCIEGPDGYTCDCIGGYLQPNCARGNCILPLILNWLDVTCPLRYPYHVKMNSYHPIDTYHSMSHFTLRCEHVSLCVSDPCVGVDCGYFGTCVDGVCVCEPRFTGPNCFRMYPTATYMC